MKQSFGVEFVVIIFTRSGISVLRNFSVILENSAKKDVDEGTVPDERRR